MNFNSPFHNQLDILTKFIDNSMLELEIIA